MIAKSNPIDSLYDLLQTLNDFKINYKHFISSAEINSFVKRHMTTKMVLIVGANPSTSSPSLQPFHIETQSRQIVDSWFQDDTENLYRIFYTNLYNHRTLNNRPLSTNEIRTIVPNLNLRIQHFEDYGCRVVSCGKQVSSILTSVGVEHFAMPHPSGLNRFWNNKVAGEAKIKEMREWISNKHTE